MASHAAMIAMAVHEQNARAYIERHYRCKSAFWCKIHHCHALNPKIPKLNVPDMGRWA